MPGQLSVEINSGSLMKNSKSQNALHFMHIDTEYHGELSCEIHTSGTGSQYVGTLRYKSFEIGHISAPDASFLRAQFQAICEMTDAGAMVRRGIILTGYHNRDFSGDVLLVDGEVIGEWTSDEFE